MCFSLNPNYTHTHTHTHIFQVIMWPRLVASKILKKRLLGSNNFVADFPSDSSDYSTTTTMTNSCNLPEDTNNLSNNFAQPPALALNTIFNHHKDIHKYKYVTTLYLSYPYNYSTNFN